MNKPNLNFSYTSPHDVRLIVESSRLRSKASRTAAGAARDALLMKAQVIDGKRISANAWLRSSLKAPT